VRVEAARELLAPPEDVWTFLAEPHHLPDWWPGIAGVQPDRKGVSKGARWGVAAGNRPTLLRRPRTTDLLLVTAAEPMRRFAFQLTGERIDADLTLEPRGGRRTLVALTVSGPFLVGFRRVLPRQALNRLYALCQTAADS
jgi:uncharacterized protein YndB with AHSA1/START domain